MDDTLYMTIEGGTLPAGPWSSVEPYEYKRPIKVEVIGGKVDMEAMKGTHRLLKRAIEQDQFRWESAPPDRDDRPWVYFHTLLLWVYANNPGHQLFKQLIVWFGECVLWSDWMREEGVDLLAMQTVRGHTRARRVHPAFKAAVWAEASKASSRAKTPGAVIRSLFVGRKESHYPNVSTMEKVGDHGNGRYLQATKNILQHATCISFVGDGTRLGGRETFICALMNPDTQECCWAPPQVYEF